MWTPSEELKSSKQDFVSGLLCEETGASVCCPLDSDEALTTSTNILQSFRPPQYECADNPCDEGYWPFEDSDGFMRCFQSTSALSDCRPPSVIQYDNQTEELFIMSAILNQSNKGLQSNGLPYNRKEGRQVKQSSLGAQLRLLRAEQCIGRRPQVSTRTGVV